MIRLPRPFRAPFSHPVNPAESPELVDGFILSKSPPTPMEPTTKASLRAQARRLLAALSPEARSAASAQIRDHLTSLPAWTPALTVALYTAQPTEPDLAPLLDIPGKTFCLPRVSGSTLEFHRCNSANLLRPGPWKILEPDPDHCPIIPPSEIDLLCIPGLAFARTGARLGRGGGFYDRYLTRVHPRAVKLGICFHAQLVPSLPLEIHDHAVHQVITEAEVIRCG
jgi:5-formyltetrahydrofolate cyclo-ligase